MVIKTDQKNWHRLTNIDYSKMTAICNQCGHTTIVRHGRNNRYARCQFVQIRNSIKRRHLKKYGIMPSFEIRKVTDRPRRCELCEGSQRISFDHNHLTGEFRGWLCIKCNTVLGLVNEDIGLLRKMAYYLGEEL